ncbi:phosphate acyltransferase PlsX [Mycoplasma sp. ATU-Cv-508]|uniref:phosphate acyltransferase PlsX n=1 Tax=Mycoplasma sp. ATU-Cv-508 TaxID=2048001 RepID=UPI000FDE12DD
MRKIAFDVMGNDHGVRPAVEAVVEFVKNNLDYYFYLIGDRKHIDKYVKDNERIKIVDAPLSVSSEANVRQVRRQKTSMQQAIDLVKNGQADGVISPGNSGVYLSSLTLTLKRIPGVKRPAFMPIIPTVNPDQFFVMLDVGANSVATSEMLEQWAKMGAVFAQSILGITDPRVAVLNIGTEATKGTELHQAVHQSLRKMPRLNYVGFVEPRDILNGDVDVVVCDGYGGNLVLKAMEGTALAFKKVLKNEMRTRLSYKIGGLLVKKAFKKVEQKFDYRNVGSAWVIGINGLAVKTHGNSDKQAYLSALNRLARALEENYLTKFKKVLA